MSRFHTKSWFPYVLPFLLCFSMTQAAAYFPSWALQISTAKISIGGGLIWAYRHKFADDLSIQLTKKQIALSLVFGVFGFALWFTSIHFNLISLTTSIIPSHWSALSVCVISIVLMTGSTLIIPVISELFWRSFMLRYLITQEFKSVSLGEFQLFSFVGVVFLTAIPSEYVVAVAAVSTLQNILIIWQKNLRCCILASIITNTLLALYLLSHNYHFV